MVLVQLALFLAQALCLVMAQQLILLLVLALVQHFQDC